MLKNKMRKEIERIRHERERSKETHAQEMEHLRQRLAEIQAKMEQVRSRECPVHRYASLLKDEKFPNYILILQAQVCRQVHYMGVDDAQLRLAKKTRRSLKKFSRKQRKKQLERALRAVEAKVDINEDQQKLQHEHNKQASPGIDHLVDEISKLKEESPEEEIIFEDLRDDTRKTVNSLDQLLEESMKSLAAFHESWSTENCSAITAASKQAE
jgi:hypothetical protein